MHSRRVTARRAADSPAFRGCATQRPVGDSQREFDSLGSKGRNRCPAVIETRVAK